MNSLKNLSKDKLYIFVCVGLPLSGKSTYTNFLKRELGNCVSFDKIEFYRQSCSIDASSKNDMKFIQQLKYDLIRVGIQYKKNVILDDCNFDVEKLSSLIEYIYSIIDSSYHVIIVDFTTVEFDTVFKMNQQLKKYNDLTYYILYPRIDDIQKELVTLSTQYKGLNIITYHYEKSKTS